MAPRPSEWQRSTTATGIDRLAAPTVAALREYLDEHAGIPDALADVTDLWETTSTKRGGLFKRASSTSQLVALGPRWLIVVARDGERPAAWTDVRAMRLTDLHVQDYEASGLAQLQADTGVTLTIQPGSPTAASLFIGLGPEQAAADLRARLHAATA